MYLQERLFITEGTLKEELQELSAAKVAPADQGEAMPQFHVTEMSAEHITLEIKVMFMA